MSEHEDDDAAADAAHAPVERARYDAGEERAIRDAAAAGGAPECPRCHVPLTRRPIGGGSFGLGYARRREWLLCPSCRRSVIFDVRRGTRT
ncbi:MAG TPA: hypothetical protein VF048_05595 [Gemmatimonadaceae bacterium]|jgi:hypothetical protein